MRKSTRKSVVFPFNKYNAGAKLLQIQQLPHANNTKYSKSDL